MRQHRHGYVDEGDQPVHKPKKRQDPDKNKNDENHKQQKQQEKEKKTQGVDAHYLEGERSSGFLSGSTELTSPWRTRSEDNVSDDERGTVNVSTDEQPGAFRIGEDESVDLENQTAQEVRNSTTEANPEETLLQAELAPDIDAAVAEALRRQQHLIGTPGVVVTAEVIPETKTLNEERKICGMRKTRFFVFLTSFLLVVLIAAILGPVLAIGSKKTPQPTLEPTTAYPTTTEPTPIKEETLAPTSVRYQTLSELLSGTLENHTLDEPSSPQHEALVWLADVDPAKLDVASTPKEVIIERFVLALFYFEAGGDGWLEQEHWLTVRPACMWSNILCRNDLVAAINIFENNITGTLPTEIGLLGNLSQVTMGNNNVTGPLPSELGNLNKLVVFDGSANLFTGSLPSEIGQMTMLTYLSLHENSLSGSIPSEVAGIADLETLVLYKNNIVGALPTEVALLKNLKMLYLFENSITGSLPTEIGLLSNLEILTMCCNALTGTIPTEIGNLRRLQNLFLFENNLVGSIPVDFTLLSNLVDFSLAENRLQGELPTELGLLTSLTRLNVFLNQFTGPVPSEIGSLSKLEVLNPGMNELTGSVPSNLENFTSLEFVGLQGNVLTTGLEELLCANTPPTFGADCWGSNPEIVCGCCNTCCKDLDGCYPVNNDTGG